jgi:hypothetical protein
MRAPEMDSSSRRVDVFFYGLFMGAELLQGMGIKPANIRIASAPGFALRIGQRATLTPDPDRRVYGVLMGLTHNEVDRLYSQKSVSLYRPEAIIAELADGSYVPALCFNLPVVPNAQEANPDYARQLRDLGHRLGLPSDYVDSIS